VEYDVLFKHNHLITSIHLLMIISCCDMFMFSDLSQLQRQQDLEVDTGGWDIRDISVVSDTRLLVAVWRERKVRLVNSQTGGLVARITLKHGPRTVCMWDNNTAVVTLWLTKKVQFIDIHGDSLTLGQSLKVNGVVWGIARSEEGLVVSYRSSPWLEVLAVNGTVLHRFKPAAGRDVFKWPLFIATSADNMVYVSDSGTSTITQLDSNLRVTKTFSDPMLQDPCGIISVSADQVLVCSYDNHRILLLCPSTGVITSILGQQDGIEKPFAMTFSPSQRKLYVVPNYMPKRVQVFQQQWMRGLSQGFIQQWPLLASLWVKTETFTHKY